MTIDSAERPPLSLPHLLVLWWGLFLLIQQVERFFLLPTALSIESPTTNLVLKTLTAGLLQDVAASTGELVVGGLLALPISLVVFLFSKRKGFRTAREIYAQCFAGSAGLLALILIVIMTVDMGYYRFSHQHLDFVFFEYIDDLLHAAQQEATSQAAEQTSAELEDASKWIVRISGFLAFQAIVIAIWCIGFVRRTAPLLARWDARRPLFLSVILTAAVGLSPFGLGFAPVMAIESENYYCLAQNPILFLQEPLRDALLSQWAWTSASLPESMTIDEALKITHEVLGRDTLFPFERYPLVKEEHTTSSPRFSQPVNVLLIFVEGLDRRYVNREIVPIGSGHEQLGGTDTIRLTPFLDRLKQDSVYFEHFFSNGVQTTRGLFASLCSAFPRQGTAVIKTRNAHDYLCLPTLLHKGGLRTEMVVSLDSDLPGLRFFLEHNGLDRFYSEQDFPRNAERLGIGLTDGALFDFVSTRIETLQAGKTPFFLATMTSSTHHPFTVPQQHPDVRALYGEHDQYPAALRYFDLEFERFFTGLQAKGLLKNTMVFILGDHGRHEPVGHTDVERQAGHFLSPLFIWVDDSIRSQETYRPHVVERIASQVDLAPTVLAINGLAPRISPFVGRDLSCLLVGDCLQDNFAYLTSVYDDLIGLVDQSGFWLYSFHRRSLTHADLTLNHPSDHPASNEPEAALRYRHMLALYLTSNTLVEQNRIWSWKNLADKL